MKVTAKSEEPQLRSAKMPYTSVTIKVSPPARTNTAQAQRDKEMVFLSLLARALNPTIEIDAVNDALRGVVEAK